MRVLCPALSSVSEANVGLTRVLRSLNVAIGCRITEFCCYTRNSGRSCSDIVKANVPGCLINAIGAVMNNSRDILFVKNVLAGELNLNGVYQGQTAEFFDNRFELVPD